MKTLKLTAIALLLAGTSSFVFAGPGPQYWANRSTPAKTTPATVTAAATTTAAAPAGAKVVCTAGTCGCKAHS